MFLLSRKYVLIAVSTLALTIYLYLLGEPEQPVFDHMVIAARGSDMPIFWVKTDSNRIAFTFDISWGTKTLPRVLEVLRQKGVKATFFLSGPWAERHEDLVKGIVADGHEIASHGQEHINLSQYDRETVAGNISKAHGILKRVSGKEARFFRPPNGDYDDLVVQTARALNYETVIWSVDSLDWKNPGAGYMIQRVTDLAFPGAIVLFHASDSSKEIDQALGAIIDNLRAKGYRITTLGELFDTGKPVREDPRGRPDYPPARLTPDGRKMETPSRGR